MTDTNKCKQTGGELKLKVLCPECQRCLNIVEFITHVSANSSEEM